MSSEWDSFIGWARVVHGSIDLDAEENDYKRATAAELAAARQEFFDGADGWARAIIDALRRTNLLHWRTISRIEEAATERPTAFEDAVRVLWDDEADVDATTLGPFDGPIREAVDGITPGNVVAFGALLLMARDAESFPPYRTTPVEKWRKLVGRESLGAGPVKRYGELLELCDELSARSKNAGIELADRLEAQSLGWTVVNIPPHELVVSAPDQHSFARWRGDKELPPNVPRGAGPSPRMESAAWKVLGAGLRRASSPIGGGASVWTAAAASDLRQRISRDPGVGTFMDKLLGQLDGAPDQTILLAAELVYLQCGPQSDLRPETKLGRVERVLAKAGYSLPDDLREGLEAGGAFAGGQGYNAQVAKHIDWLTKFILEWTDTGLAERAAALESPDPFAVITARVEPGAVVSVEHVINYLAWPGHFSPVVAANHRRRIRQAFAELIGGPTGDNALAVTTDLRKIRHLHESEAGGYPEWYSSPYREEWGYGEPRQRAWLVRPGPGHGPQVERWLSQEFVSLAAEHLGEIEPRADKATVQAAVDAGYQHLDYAQRKTFVTEFLAFLSQMQEGDVVCTVSEGHLFVGVVQGEATYVDDGEARLRRAATWSGRGTPLEDLAEQVGPVLDTQGAVVDVTSALAALRELVDAASVGEPSPPTHVHRDAVPDLPAVTEDVARSLYMDRSELQEIVDLLQTRQQIVFYGPPGTGKTYLAKHLARHLVGPDDPSRARLVQFHPSYSYEDFFEGYRPSVSDAGAATFTLQAGPLRQLASEAAQPENLSDPFVLIIDEMNRTNLAKVFGELYYLLEYRNDAIRLQYDQGQAFRLPKNLFIIGTMNTADRSIAMVDAAIRRRFAFVELHPSEPPVRGLLEEFLERYGHDRERAALLEALNLAIGVEDRDMQIGPSYLMRPDIDEPGGLERVWKYDLLPLLEEHYYGRHDRTTIHQRFGLAALRAGLARAALRDEDDGGPAVP